MIRYALIINVPGESQKTYSAVYENQEFHDLYTGVSDMDMACELMERLVEEGYETVNLCGDFDDEAVVKISAIGQGKVKVRAARYLPGEKLKLEALAAAKEYGFISLMDVVDRIERLELKSEECNTHIFLVRDLDMARLAAKELAGMGVDLIELCGWFDRDKTQVVIDAIRCGIPVGSCGL